MGKFSTFSEFAFYVLLLLALPPAVISIKIQKPRMCAVCLEKDCATGVSEIYPADSDTAVWARANSPTGIQQCFMENLKPDAPCKMANGILVQLAKQTLRFEGTNPPDKRRVFYSQSLLCADLYLPPSSTPSPAPIDNTPTPEAPNHPVADNKGIIIVIGIIILILILIVVLIWKRKKRRQGQDREITIKKQAFKRDVPNGNFNGEDNYFGPTGLLEHWDNTPV